MESDRVHAIPDRLRSEMFKDVSVHREIVVFEKYRRFNLEMVLSLYQRIYQFIHENIHFGMFDTSRC